MQTFRFFDGLNAIIGNNAQGKTNLLEAIYYASIGKSVRTTKDVDLINFKSDFGSISLEVLKKEGKKKIDIVFSKTHKKAVQINGISISKIAELLGCVNCVFFSPDELKLVKEAPQDRRKFLDTEISQLNKTYFYNLVRYNKILVQRNKLLKSTNNFETIKNTLPIWNKQLANVGAKIILERMAFIKRLEIYAKEKLLKLTSSKENLTLDYAGINFSSAEEIEDEFIKQLEESEEKDIRLGYTTIGPHRDDIKIVVNDLDIRSFGSQGQQRTVALAMKLAELEIFKNERGEYPILLLDDVFSELDKNRKIKLIECVKGVQTLITGTDFNFDVPVNIIKIDGGKQVETEN